jgi:hypothetical protein
MGSEITRKPTPAELDGFAGYTDTAEGEVEQTSDSLIVGDKIVFNEAQVWVDGSGNKLPSELELVLVKVLRIVQKWGPDNKPIKKETRILEPGQKWLDLDKLNAACPQSEWREKFGKMQGPYQGQRLAYLVDQETMARYTWPSPKDTVGSRICVEDIIERINWMRRFRGDCVYPVVTLADTFMPTGYGGRQRPHFIVKRWISFGANGEVRELETAVQKALDDFSTKQNDAQTVTPSTAKTVTPPTAKEVRSSTVREVAPLTANEIPF